MENPPRNSKTKTEEKENNPVYTAYLDIIKERPNRIRFDDLKTANQQGLLSKDEFDSLHSEFTKKLENIAGIDHLTGVPTRAYLEPQFKKLKIELNHTEQERRKFQIESIMMLTFDIDDFKRLNDTYGHNVGDDVLVVVAERIKKDRRINDTVFRTGGDEFVAILPIDDKNLDTIEKVLGRIKQDMNEKLYVNVEGKEVPINVSVGCSVVNKGDETTLAQALKESDRNMYVHKRRE